MAEPLSLGFGTSAAHCAAALLQGDRLLVQHHEDMARGQAERLFPLLGQVLAEAGVGWRDLSVIGCGIGPGNFTGIRISVAAARGLALSLGIPAVGVSVTEAAAHGLPRPCRVAVPSRMGEVIWQDFGTGAATRPQQAPAHELPPGPAPLPAAMPLAEAIARIAAARRDQPDLPRPAPIYLRPADAAPARDRGPLILS
ncbi:MULTISPECIES: tRNA (adenosine(37)-N6)-threonylcarbamoyltransferase complex dimerization subunit type 1 TsaB [Paracoccus]|uniref:tRNA (adenosine(37)-N6)-threonylcarbamoyltransferase complex dimerization subunit type 1 TsaB n=1 Tax=Paracoccus TaxID=265 RepID=UPI001FB63815|nr:MULTISPECIES: tRNA (adenosine(37)-N6)-threonylcarbamoyltransferase complex dimerization subunit type 1 TsaB [Paracoccus]MCJ1898890.1 tRNA (adenosine(37)-N6)-threonylcarbamoyltransferase complex dimerization subunit type 1 TsaB [Paracoccus versutus]MDF3903296.1 tRNA (adenosine(37)-N6)-threonylcarbamoyltransferase complex dimerization subunit type 1 TsaB [Paracoccus sp. AS002]WGR61065.1 tRNA (adenosine(37)-N6)-threonylcarbamoyltransferase complex dimerization subunit type 1 TsaB [Paracoccus fer